MTVISIASSRTSPGATSLAAGLAIAASHRADAALLVEADPKGGMISLRFGLAPHPSLATFGTDTRNTYTHELLWKNTQNLRGAHCIPGPVDPRIASSWAEHTSTILANKVGLSGAAVFIDLGFLAPSAPLGSVAAASDLTIVVTRPSIAEVQSMLFQVEQLQALGANVALVTVGSTPNDPNEVASVAGVPLLAVLPDDAAAASVLSGGDMPPKKFKRTKLWRTVDGIAASCLETWPVQPAQYIDVVDSVDEAGVAPSDDVVDPAQRPNPVPRPEAEPAALATPALPATAAPAATPAPQVPAPVPVVEPIANPAITPAAPAAPGVVMSEAPAGWPGAEATPAVPGVAQIPTPAPQQVERIIVPQIREDQPPVPAQPQSASPAPATLVSADGSRCVLPTDRTLVLGRDVENDISINDRLISRAHAHLRPTEMGWLFIDLGSTNGSLVNGQRVSQMLLSPGDELTLGGTSIVFSPPARILESV